jgi:hypothetical protein
VRLSRIMSIPSLNVESNNGKAAAGDGRLTSKAGEGEHADLVRDVVPAAGRAILHQAASERHAHLSNALRHDHELLLPQLKVGAVAQDSGSDASAVRRWARVHGTNDDAQLGLGGLEESGIGHNSVEGTDALAIQAHVLGVGLGAEELETALDEETNRASIAIQIAYGKAVSS